MFLIDGQLRVGHDRKAARTGGNFETSYLEPLRALVARCNRLTSTRTNFLLTIELKEPSRATYDSLTSLVSRYHMLLQAVDVVLVGWHPPLGEWSVQEDSLFRVQQRLDRRDDFRKVDRRLRLISLDYGKTIGRWWGRPSMRKVWLTSLRNARASAPHLLIRAHNVPADAKVYRTLLDAGVDLIGTRGLVNTARILRNVHPSQTPD